MRPFASRFLLIPVTVGLTAMATVIGCGNISLNTGFEERADGANLLPGGGGSDFAGSGGESTGGQAGGAGGGGGGAGLKYNDSYGYLCGGSNAICVPGTDDCTLGGDPNMGGGGNDASAIGCQLVAPSGTTEAICGAVGVSGIADPCDEAADCEAGLGCAATPSGGLCRPYCCGDVEECPQDTYCAPLPMADGPTEIPICTPTTPCELLNDSTCPAGQTCSIVRDHGVTSCIDPGPGQLDEDCPCAAGLFCSKVTKTCVKLCHTDGNLAECGPDGSCYGGVDEVYPPGYGVCVMY